DLHFTINDQFTSGEKVSTRWTAKGTNTGPFGEMQPTGKQVEVEGLIIDYVVNGKVERRWEQWDQMAMMQQLGLM
ncbi:MAG TPA: ester cyclase, partial [Niastella sp.]|nr:ester cyclase [Niastella sp.]